MTALAPSVRRRLDATDIARAGVFAAVIAVLGVPGAFTIFGAVPITAQTLGVMLAGAILGPAVGALSVTAVLALVAAGLPLLAGGRGGIGVFFGPTGGYLLGWIVGVVIIGLIVHAAGRRPVWWRTFLGTLVGGVLVVYAVGVPVQALVLRIGLGEAALSSLVFLPGDLLKVVATTLIVGTLVRGYPRAFRRQWRSLPATAA
ncbi:biotin transport system substrate-specific component [Microbacterium sp. SORGH_AS428]|uniref:biotin transporter BioY n=1 Tax=Microbacterium sp. SORGH_AS_0428 TaxID=3041788 RepID=UPI0028660555|nr:biotin transporter BioY [Microbacterium sp. SORGH_AS_0428]MDR6198818.1 biotin transport system substrate-specific component [Microbacterium sp. SORGH_AS_0428]